MNAKRKKVRMFTKNQLCCIGLGDHSNDAAVAREFGCSRKEVIRVERSLGLGFMSTQLVAIEKEWEFMVSLGDKLLWGIFPPPLALVIGLHIFCIPDTSHAVLDFYFDETGAPVLSRPAPSFPALPGQ